MKLCLMILSV